MKNHAHLYAPIYQPVNVQTENAQLHIDWFSQSRDPINTDSSQHFVRPREHYDIMPRPNVLGGFLSTVFPLMDIWSQSNQAAMSFGLNPLDPAGSSLPLPMADYTVNGLYKVG